MNRKDLIQRVMKVAEHYKNGDLYATGVMTDIGILVDEYTETVVKNCYIPAVSKRYICECGKKQTVQEMREEIGEGYTQYCCKGCGDVLIDDIKGVVYCNVC